MSFSTSCPCRSLRSSHRGCCGVWFVEDWTYQLLSHQFLPRNPRGHATHRTDFIRCSHRRFSLALDVPKVDRSFSTVGRTSKDGSVGRMKKRPATWHRPGTVGWRDRSFQTKDKVLRYKTTWWCIDGHVSSPPRKGEIGTVGKGRQEEWRFRPETACFLKHGPSPDVQGDMPRERT